MELQERLQREGKIAQLQKELKELEVRIRNRQNAIRWAVSPTHTLTQLQERTDELDDACKGYIIAFQRYAEAAAHLKRLQEEQ